MKIERKDVLVQKVKSEPSIVSQHETKGEGDNMPGHYGKGKHGGKKKKKMKKKKKK